jgi:hypothetical protein
MFVVVWVKVWVIVGAKANPTRSYRNDKNSLQNVRKIKIPT